jgi:Mn-dependent DtxR family transcriptional regulator
MTPEYYLDDDQTKAMRAFRHKSRRQVVACTSTDLANRLGLSVANVKASMWKLSFLGIVSALTIKKTQTYDLTPKGRKMLEEIMK